MSKLYQYDDMDALNALSLKRSSLNQNLSDEAKNRIQAFAEGLEVGVFPAFSIALGDQDLKGLYLLVEKWKAHFKHVVFLGVGGSSLGAQTLVSFMGKYANSPLKIYFLDNVDPSSMDDLLQNLPLDETVVMTFSKSGSTIETMAQTLLFMDAFEKRKLPLSLHMVGLTENKPNPLRTLLTGYEVPILDHPEHVGGRFTILTLVGLIPAIVAGVDVFKIRKGAAQVLTQFLENPLKSDAYYGALLTAGSGEKMKPIQYMMPYSDKLIKFSDWFVQLWAESLGKEGKGSTPVPAVGSTDQHSALQLLMDGPSDKLVTFIMPDSTHEGGKIPKNLAEKSGLEHLTGLNLGKLIQSQAHGTAEALSAVGVPVRIFHTQSLHEEVLGALLMHFMLETAVAGCLLDVNTWDQPGVEASKEKTLHYLQNRKN
jgi:glucose-6-phosphate isomerase